MALTQQRITFEDLLAIPDDGHFYELLDGEVFLVSGPDNDHGDVVDALYGWLRLAQLAGYGRVCTSPRPVILDGSVQRRNAPEPDVFFVARQHVAMLAGRWTEGIPDLIIEVLSEATRVRDLPGGKKWDVYERFGVSNYWIVDVETRTVAQYTWRDGRYEFPLLARRGDVLRTPLAPGLALEVDELFAGMRQPELPLRGLGPFGLNAGKEPRP